MIQAVQQYISIEMSFLLCLSVMSDSMIMDAIASFLVLPNRLVVPLVPGLHVAQLRSPLPRVNMHLQIQGDYFIMSHLSLHQYITSPSLFFSLREWYASTCWRHRI